MGHKQTALTLGAKAGFRQYVKRLSTFGEGTPQADALDELLGAGNSKQQFEFYCDKFLSGGSTAAVAEKSQTEREALISSIVDEDDDAVGVEVEAEGIIGSLKREVAKRTRKPRNGAIGVGTEFVYHGKDADTTHAIVGETKTKRGKVAWSCENDKGKARPWNKKSLALYIENGKVELA